MDDQARALARKVSGSEDASQEAKDLARLTLALDHEAREVARAFAKFGAEPLLVDASGGISLVIGVLRVLKIAAGVDGIVTRGREHAIQADPKDWPDHGEIPLAGPFRCTLEIPSMVKPISPDEIAATKVAVFPDGVIEAFNELIAEKFVNTSATVLQKDAVARIIAKMGGDCDEQKILDRGWLNVEEIYRGQGWTVRYEKPDYTESFPSSFTFTKFTKHY